MQTGHYRKHQLNLEKNLKLLLKSKYILIAFQENFEDIDNLKYFYSLKKEMIKNFQVKIIKNKFYKGNIINRQNHYYFIAKKLKNYFKKLVNFLNKL